MHESPLVRVLKVCGPVARLTEEVGYVTLRCSRSFKDPCDSQGQYRATTVLVCRTCHVLWRQRKATLVKGNKKTHSYKRLYNLQFRMFLRPMTLLRWCGRKRLENCACHCCFQKRINNKNIMVEAYKNLYLKPISIKAQKTMIILSIRSTIVFN